MVKLAFKELREVANSHCFGRGPKPEVLTIPNYQEPGPHSQQEGSPFLTIEILFFYDKHLMFNVGMHYAFFFLFSFLILLLEYAAAAKSLQSCPSLCDPRDGSPPIPVIFQARTLEWVAISFSNA